MMMSVFAASNLDYIVAFLILHFRDKDICWKCWKFIVVAVKIIDGSLKSMTPILNGIYMRT
jgi:hypothetical protein